MAYPGQHPSPNGHTRGVPTLEEGYTSMLEQQIAALQKDLYFARVQQQSQPLNRQERPRAPSVASSHAPQSPAYSPASPQLVPAKHDADARNDVKLSPVLAHDEDDSESDNASVRSGAAENGDRDAKHTSDEDKDAPHVEKPDAEAEGDSGRILVVINRWNSSKSQWEDAEKSAKTNKITQSKSKAATLRTHMRIDNEKKVDYEEIAIHSEALQNLLAGVSDGWRLLIKENVAPVVSLESPFDEFVWYWDECWEASKAVDGDSPEMKEAREDLKLLMELLKTTNTLEAYLKARDNILKTKKIRFEFLWTLFPHGSKVYARSFLSDLQMLQVWDGSEGPFEDDKKRYRLSCSGLDWDGRKFSTYSYDFLIKRFTGEKPITSLEVFPAKFYSDEKTDNDTIVKENDAILKEKLLDRGKKFCELCSKRPMRLQCQYEGTALVNTSALHRLSPARMGEDGSDSKPGSIEWHDEQWEEPVVKHNITSKHKVIIDNFAFMTSSRNTARRADYPPVGKRVPYDAVGCQCRLCKVSALQSVEWDDKLDHTSDDYVTAFANGERGDERLMFLPPRLLGFVLKSKVWAQFAVSSIERKAVGADPGRDSAFWRQLQLEEEHKELLMALVEGHAAPPDSGDNADGSKSKAVDIVDGKGEGLAIMLHGPPGVGKTLTAETIAHATGRPLITVSVAEIGIDPVVAEAKLSEIFVDAARWEAVLLIDEADVFVEKRETGDIARNATVSVLLRCLEYYKGIIILTTNRVLAIDIAVQSRIHLSIQYTDLKPEFRLAIWKDNLNRVDPAKINIDMTSKNNELERFAKRNGKVNGRQIRNIVTSARALALAKNDKLGVAHLEIVAESTAVFMSNMETEAMSQRARGEAPKR